MNSSGKVPVGVSKRVHGWGGKLDQARNVGNQENNQGEFCQCQESDHRQGGDGLAHVVLGNFTFQSKNCATLLRARSRNLPQANISTPVPATQR